MDPELIVFGCGVALGGVLVAMAIAIAAWSVREV
jgi:hypothetical protein